jgi:hypothetical protein
LGPQLGLPPDPENLMPSYPSFTGGFIIQRPWTREKEFHNAHNDMSHGYRYSFNLRATPLMRFTIEYPSLSNVDLVTLRDFFVARKGSYEEFDFTDPETTTVHTKCRFAQEAIEVNHVGWNQNGVRVVIQEYA